VFALTVARADRARDALRVGGCQTLPDSAREGLCGRMVRMGNGLSAFNISMTRFAVLLSRLPSLTGADRLEDPMHRELSRRSAF